MPIPDTDTEELSSYPVWPRLDHLTEVLLRGGLVLRAEPGAGKTTLLPWRLLTGGHFSGTRILLVQPRRLAARSAAERIASLLGEPLGQRVGVRTRTETITSPRAELEVITDGVMVRILQQDPALSGISVLLFDEFHLRTLSGELSLALSLHSRELFRPDLKIALLSATLPVESILDRFTGFVLEDVSGRGHPVETFYRPPYGGERIEAGATRLVQEALNQTGGDVLVFLPGYREMDRTRRCLVSAGLPPERILLLYGSLPPQQQREVLDSRQAGNGRVILSTNVAETSLTVPGVTAVVDTGYERRVRYRPRTGMNHRETVPISHASADQRRGRAGRLAPGVCFRWWKEGDYREPFSPPEIQESDLSPLSLETALWGVEDPRDLHWITPPSVGAVSHAREVLTGLGFLDDDGRITADGRKGAETGLHPRLAAMVLAADSDTLRTALSLALLMEEPPAAMDRTMEIGSCLAETECSGGSFGKDLRRLASRLGLKDSSWETQPLRPDEASRLLLKAWPERAGLKTGESDRPGRVVYRLADGQTAELKGEGGGPDALVAAGVEGSESGGRTILLMAPLDRRALEKGDLVPLSERDLLQWDGWRLRFRRGLYAGRLMLKEIPAVQDRDSTARAVLDRLECEGLEALPWDPPSRSFLARIRAASRQSGTKALTGYDEGGLLARAGQWLVPFCRPSQEIVDGSILLTALRESLTWAERKMVEERAPEALVLPSGQNRKVDYESGDVPVVSARLQEFFGLAETPRIGGEPVLLDLLSPAGRTVQKTRDLASFWANGYPEVKKDLAGRYPRHYWPDNPLLAEATSRAKPKSKLSG